MRRTLGTVLIALGAFLVISALLVRFYAYPKLATAPIDQDSVTELQGLDATVFSIADLAEVQTDLSVATTTRGDVDASQEAGDNVRVWAGTTTVKTADGTILSQSIDRTAFDGTTAEAINCCGAFEESTEGERQVTNREGLVYKFPFDAKKQSYPVWDDSVAEAVDAEFVDEAEIDGLPVYVYEQVINRQEVAQRTVPGSVVGETDDTVTADVYYANTRTFWVEPTTGAIIDRTEEQNSTLAVDGEDRVTTTAATLEYTDEQVAKNVADIKPKATQLGLVQSTVPLIAGILGLVLLGVGFLLSRRGRHEA